MSHSLVGRFVDVVGLDFRSGPFHGTTGPAGEFQYKKNGKVSFSIGQLNLGETRGKSTVNILDCVEQTDLALTEPKLLNRARLLFSLTSGEGFEKAIVIDEKIRTVISKYANELDLDSPGADLEQVLLKIGAELRLTIKTIPHVRNHLRRAAAGFKVLRDIRIPVRDGEHVLADVYLPLDDSIKYPVLLSCTIYGKRVVYSGPNLEDRQEVARFEKAEDDWFSTSAEVPLDVPNTGPWFGSWTKQRKFETIATFNTFTFVPKGYAMVKVDPRGVSQTPGTRGVPGQEADDVCDAVEWTAAQSWCTGNIALAGNSYGANVQWSVARKKPKGLKAFIPFAGDIDRYRDVVFIGGIPLLNYLRQWLAGIRAASPRWNDTGDIVEYHASFPFQDGDVWANAIEDLASIDLPCFMAASQLLFIHCRGSYEAWRELGSKEKHLQIVDANYYGWPSHQVAEKIIQFADRHLKGVEGVKVEPIGLQMRVGNGLWYWRAEGDWVIPGTEYVKWYLQGDGTLSKTLTSSTEKVLSYSAESEPKGPAGTTFVSQPFHEDVELAGHFTATIYVSSSNHDADVVVQLWVMDAADNVVQYCIDPRPQPMALGVLRASHRKIDPAKSLPWRPWHTHTKEDYAPLSKGEVVKLEVEIFPATARIREGWKLRVDITPSEEQPSIQDFHPPQVRLWEKDIHDGATNSVHVGGDYVSFVTLPVVPMRGIGQLGSVPSHYEPTSPRKI
ncbi:alpha/beta-hydrolase [Cadophora sp. DSE1049]|nr:alpha/beta-hydrolase [Cadophora sp. DSE1049]